MPGKTDDDPEFGHRVVSRAAGRTLFDTADELALQVPTSCGRTGRCRECIVEVTAGADALTPPTPAEGFLRGDFRLACQAEITDSDAQVAFDVVRRRLRIVAGEADEREAPIDPKVTVLDGVVRWGDEEIEPLRGGVYGMAIDIGTTTCALELADLQTGRVIEVVTLENPQRFGGSDVMNRISYDTNPESHGELQYALRKALNQEFKALYARHQLDRREIYEIVIVGNATMRDMFFKLDVEPIGQKPYKSTTETDVAAGLRESTELLVKAHELGLWCNPQARVWGAPLIASHVGGDVVADLVAIGFDPGAPGVRMLVDVGTNTEVIVATPGRIIAASCPAGPAFEGGEVTYGMQASDGAIEGVKIGTDGDYVLSVIGDVEPRGLCGSGLIDLLAELRRTDAMTPKGVFADKARTLEIDAVNGITFSRADASALAQAKAANTVGQWILMRHLGVAPDDIDTLYLAGGFASYIDVRNSIDIGFLAPVPEDRVVKVGNAALRGARELLLSASARARLPALIAAIEHVELETTEDFFELFVDGCQFKPFLTPADPAKAGGRLVA
ncbi:MAG TPA: ASKHA domain-containing protein [Baekduia sp.]|nr:ASKHA domain-containing protein [Baekduia sp.]